MLEAALFDMDGLLIDSEPFWKKAEREVFGSVGIAITDEMTIPTRSMTTGEVTDYWYRHKPWHHPSMKEVEQKVVAQVGQLVEEGGIMMPGVIEILALCKQNNLKIGLATNAPAILIPKILSKLNIKEYFDAAISADEVFYRKPHPDVYLAIAQKLGVHPSNCIVFEDSVYGVHSALQAGMKVVAVPAKAEFYDDGFNGAHIKLESLKIFSSLHYHKLSATYTTD